MSKIKKQKNKKTKKQKRTSDEYAALNKKYQSKAKGELLDFDYLNQLNKEEKDWLNKFSEEYINATLILDDDKNIISDANIHQTPEHKKDIYDRNNARNRDQYGRVKNRVGNTKLINYDIALGVVEDQLSRNVRTDSTEDAYLDYIQYKEIQGFINEYNNAMLLFNEETG